MKILSVIKTTGLIYDDRLRKEANSLQKLGCEYCILALEHENREIKSELWNHIKTQTICLHSRRWFKRSKGLFLKTLEMYLKMSSEIWKRKPQVAWVHNMEMIGLVIYCLVLRGIKRINTVVWDLHELPGEIWFDQRVFNGLLKLILNRCDNIIAANEERKDLMVECFSIEEQKFIVMENWPDRKFKEVSAQNLPPEITGWLRNRPYVLAQGGASPKRRLFELVEAVHNKEDLCLIVIGPFSKNDIEKLRLKYPELDKFVLFTGFVPQMDMPIYIDNALFSAVFYQTDKENSRLCAPNRMYQALVRGVPVLTGLNPPMNKIVNRFKCGVSVECSEINQMAKGITEIQKNLKRYTEGAREASTHILWENQENKLLLINKE